MQQSQIKYIDMSKKFTQILSIFVLLITVFSSTAVVAQESKATYCNERYDFCLKYPDTIFSQKDESTNDDGVILRSSSNDIRLRVYGYHNVLVNDASAELDSYIEMVELENEKIESVLISEKREVDLADCYLRQGRRAFYLRTINKGEDMIGLMLEVNRSKELDYEKAKELLDQLVSDLEL